MNQRGMGFVGAIVAMVIAGVIVYGVIFHGPSIWRAVQGGGGTPGGVLLYPGSEMITVNGEEVPAMITATQWSGRYYTTLGEIAEIEEWYRAEMPESGWTLTYDFGAPSYNPTHPIVGYTKGDDATIIVINRDRFEIYSGPTVRLSDAIEFVCAFESVLPVPSPIQPSTDNADNGDNGGVIYV